MIQRNLLTGVWLRLAAGIAAAAAVVLVTIALTPAKPPNGPPRTGWMANFTPSEVPAPAPETPFTDVEGRRRTLADFRGKVVLVNFWATWCGPCVREMPSLQRLAAQFAGDTFAVLALSQDRRGWEVMTPFLARLGLEGLPVFHDEKGSAAGALKVQGLPTTVLFDRSGRELGRLVGPAEWDAPEAVALVRHYLDR
jgi:thiol-disulfide isomerase/thioredoxin